MNVEKKLTVVLHHENLWETFEKLTISVCNTLKGSQHFRYSSKIYFSNQFITTTMTFWQYIALSHRRKLQILQNKTLIFWFSFFTLQFLRVDTKSSNFWISAAIFVWTYPQYCDKCSFMSPFRSFGYKQSSLLHSLEMIEHGYFCNKTF